MSQTGRPRYLPEQWASKDGYSPLVSESSGNSWVPLIRCPADFPVELFEIAISQLIHHPEYNSTLILRSEVLSDKTSHFPPCSPVLRGFQAVQNIHRKLLPRRPGRDASIEQHCTLYASCEADDHALPSILVLTPIVEPGSSLPYYHPSVSHLAFRYIPSDQTQLQIEVVPLPDTPTDLESRLYRTCLALLETLHRYGWGALTKYKKRVLHDCIVPRETYQDLYLLMRERHKYLINEWKETTDPLKHVFEDIGIATFLMLLWKQTFGGASLTDSEISSSSTEREPWKQWPRPPGGFLDLGCGNGLLTHILTAEGYEGSGIDLRARTSWSHYPESTQQHLHVIALDPSAPFDDPSAASENRKHLHPGVFIIGNHADELTPWVPVLSTLCSASGYLSIPCCAWSFDTRYERSKTALFPIPSEDFVDTLNLGGEGSNTSAYSMYRIWLASLSLYCGWQIECETLRIPSTRNWALIGRKHTWKTDDEAEEALQHVKEIIAGVRERGLFKTRRPEGKAGDH